MLLSELMQKNPNIHADFNGCCGIGFDRCACEFIRSKQTLFHSQSPIGDVLYIVSGELWAFNEYPNSKNCLTEHIYAGSFVGEMELLGMCPRYVSTVTTITNCMLVRIPHEIYMNWFETCPAFARQAAVRCARMLCYSASKVGINRVLNAFEAVCLLLSDLYRMRVGTSQHVTIRETRQELAEKSNVSIRSVNRAVAQLCNEGIITLKKGKIVIDADGNAALWECAALSKRFFDPSIARQDGAPAKDSYPPTLVKPHGVRP